MHLLSESNVFIVLCVCCAPFGMKAEDSQGIRISFSQPGAVYHANEKGQIFITPNGKYNKLTLNITDIDGKEVEKKTYRVATDNVITHDFREKHLGYYALTAIGQRDDNSADTVKTGFGVIPDVTLHAKDWDSPFGVCGHFVRYDYKKKHIASVQQRLGIAWLRDESNWMKVAKENLLSDPDLDYLDKHNICWLNLFGYINSFNGIQGKDSVWRWDEDLALLKKYVELTKGHFQVFESQNEPNNFGGWSKRWPHPQGQQWRPHGWGKPFSDLLKQMHDSIAAVDPGIRLMWPGEDEWIEYFVEKNNAASRIDITTIHPYVNASFYPETEKYATGEYARRKAALRKLGVNPEIWVTELGWTTYQSQGKNERYIPVTEKQQAAFLVRTYLSHLYYGAKKVFWYELADEPFGIHNPESSFGLIRFDESLTVKPSAVAYSNMVNMYRHAVPTGKYTGNCYGFAYRNADENMLCLWTKEKPQEEILSLPHTKKVTLTDIYGRSRTLKVRKGQIRLTISGSPVTLTGINDKDMEALYTPRPTD